MQRWKRERKKMDRIHSGLDYALNWRPIPCPICPLATIRRSVTRPDWKWLFFQTLLKCVCVSPITLLLLIKLEPPLRSQWRDSPFSFPSFLFFYQSRCGSSEISCEVSCAQVHRFGIVTTDSCRVRFWAHPTACIWRSMPLNKSVKTILMFALTHVLSNRSRLDKHLLCGRSILQAVTGWSTASRVPLANSLSHTGGEHLASSGKAGDQSRILPISFHFDVSPFRERAYPLSAVQPHHPEGPGYSWSHRLWALRHRKPSRQRSGW